MRAQRIEIKHRMLALLLVVVLVIGCLPGVVFAQEPDAGNSKVDTSTTQNEPQSTGAEDVPVLTDPVNLTVRADHATVTVVDDADTLVQGADQVYTVERGTTLTVTITPEGNGYVSAVTVGDQAQSQLPEKGQAYTVDVEMDDNKEISATIVQRYYVSVQGMKDEAGSVTLDAKPYTAPVLVDENTNVEVKISAKDGYQVQRVSFGDAVQTVSDPTQFTGTLTGIQSDTEIHVTFVKVYTVTVTYTGAGAVVTEPNGGSVTVEEGKTVTITATPDTNNRVEEVTINNVPDESVTGANDSGYTTELTADKPYTVVITFAPNVYDVTVTETQHGQVQVAPTVEHGSTPKVVLTPDQGYTVDTVMVNHTPVNTFTKDDTGIWFQMPTVTGTVTVTATFKEAATASKSDVTVEGSEALRSDGTGTLYVLDRESSVQLSTNQMGIRLLDDQGRVIVGDAHSQSVSIAKSATIESVELYYQAQDELYADWHRVAGWTAVEIVVDIQNPETTFAQDEPNESGFYNDSFTVLMSVTDPQVYSGIASVEYFVTDTPIGDDVNYNQVTAEQKTQSGTLYTYSSEINSMVKKEISIEVTENKNNSDNVVVWVKATDRAGNIQVTKSQPYMVNCTLPEISVSIDGTLDAEASEGFYNSARTATITYIDRASTFDESAAVDGITIRATDAQGEVVTISKPAMIQWTHSGNTHTATVTFDTDAHYQWSVSYTNKAGKTAESITATGDSVYAFTVDTQAPEATITVDNDIWGEIIEKLTFHLFKKDPVTATATGTDATSEVASIVYYKDNSGIVLTEEALKAQYEAGAFSDQAITVDNDEQFVIYARVTDQAGNTVYVSTNGIIYDETDSMITLDMPQANKNGYYNSSVDVTIRVNEEVNQGTAYSGLRQIIYTVKNEEKVTLTETVNFENDPLVPNWEKVVTIDGAKNNSDHVTLTVTAEDNAGNVTEKEVALSINVDKITASVKFGDEAHRMVDNYGYYGQARTATITVVDRATSFDEAAATQGITFSAVNAEGKTLALETGTDVVIGDWIHRGNQHTATVTFQTSGKYTWDFDYVNKADNILQTIDVAEDESTWSFAVDTQAPTASVSIAENVWEELLEKITFGLYSRDKVDVTAKADDLISPVEIFYYKTNETKALSQDALETVTFQPYEGSFSVEDDAIFVVYLKVVDYAGNVCYVSSDGYIVDDTPSQIVLKPEEDNGFYTQADHENGQYGLYGHEKEQVDVNIQVSDAQPYSGIQSIKYWVVKDNQAEEPQTLFTFTEEEPEFEALVDAWEGKISVPLEEYNSCDVQVYVQVTDNAGNISEQHVALDLDDTAPTATVSFDNNQDNQGNGYFDEPRTATVVITERTHHFNEEKATNGIQIQAVDATGTLVEDAYTISPWTTVEGNTPDETIHTATIFFEKDANYTWSVSYTDEAGNVMKTVDTGDSVAPYKFTVDTTKPYGTVTATSQEGGVKGWNDRVDPLTFGFWSKQGITITGEFQDDTCAHLAKVEYYKISAAKATDGTTALTEEALDQVTQWKPFDKLEITQEEQFVVYLKLTDLAGNYRYISTDGLIVDYSAPMEEVIAPEVTITPPQPINDIYNGNVEVAIEVKDPLRGGTYSGLKTVSYQVLNMGEVTQSGTLFAFDKQNPTQDELQQSWNGAITVDSQLNNSNDVKIVVFAEDNAGNSSKDQVGIQIDITAPAIEVRYDNNQADSGKYFRADRTATIVVTERNFDPDDVKTQIQNTHGTLPAMGSWSMTPGTGNGDNTKWTTTIAYRVDGDYTFDIAYTDLAGNPCAGADYGNSVAPKAFTVDKTIPTVSVSYNNNDAANGNYYNASRTATIVITEHNLEPNGVDQGRVVIRMTATDDGVERSVPTVSAWATNGDTHTATITYSADALYTFDIDVKDKAGNGAVDFQQQTFYVDQTAPTLEITGVADLSANNGDVIPVVSYSDTNYNSDQVSITLTGANRKGVALDGSYAELHNGRAFTFRNFEKKQEVDDIYTLSATLTDMAGNTTSKSITFSVNRFGSTYALSQATEKLKGTYVQDPVDVVVTETNPNALDNIKVTMFKNNETVTLEEKTDYRIDVSGGNGQWYVYSYTVFAENFVDDGVYRLTFYSEDEAGNVAENTLDSKNMEVSFGVDKTAPTLVVVNLESGKTYPVDGMTVNMTANDNLQLSSIAVYLDNYEKAYQTWDAEGIAQILSENGEFNFEVDGTSKGAHNVKIVCVDAAGNEYVEEITGFYVTTDLLVRYYNNKPLFYGSLVGLAVVVIVTAVVISRKRHIKVPQQ